jgi:CheY-like chemotaxis protein
VQGEFTEFTMRFPGISERGATAPARRRAQARTVLAGKRLLVVEDDPVQRMATRQKLAPLAATAKLDEAADGQLALGLLARRKYDIVLLDLHMPGLDGYAVAEKIRAGKRHQPGRAHRRLHQRAGAPGARQGAQGRHGRLRQQALRAAAAAGGAAAGGAAAAACAARRRAGWPAAASCWPTTAPSTARPSRPTCATPPPS